MNSNEKIFVSLFIVTVISLIIIYYLIHPFPPLQLFMWSCFAFGMSILTYFLIYNLYKFIFGPEIFENQNPIEILV